MRPPGALIHLKAFGDSLPSPLSEAVTPHPVSVSAQQPDSRAGARACVLRARVLTVLCIPPLSAGISLLVPHGGIAEDTTWEMYMIINQEDSR